MSYIGCKLGSDCSCDASESSWCKNRGYGEKEETTYPDGDIEMAYSSPKKKLRPADCKDIASTMLLEEQGIFHNGEGIVVEPNSVIITMGHTTLKVPMFHFKRWAEWYLAEQDINHDHAKNLHNG